MTKAKDLLLGKGRDVWCIGPAQSVYQAIEMMALKEIGALAVVDDKGELVGIISERDYARKVILKNKSSRDTPVSEIMTSKLIVVGENASVNECMALMTEKKIRHLPVVEEGKMCGIISLGDLVKSIIDEQSHVIDQLERYIKGDVTSAKL